MSVAQPVTGTAVAPAQAAPKETPKPSKRPRAAKPDAEGDDDKPDSGTWLLVAKAVRLYLKTHESSMHCGSDALPALNAKLADLLREASGRARANGRKTLKASDF